MTASDKSNSSQLALPFSSDTGSTSPDGETSTTSPLLPTPKSDEAGWKPDGDQDPAHRPYQDGKHRSWGVSQVVETLLPTPNTFDDLPATRTAEERKADTRGGFANLRERVDDLLPTPSAEKHSPQRREDFTPNLTARVQALLPTPRYEGYDAGNHRGKPDGLNQTVRYLPTPTLGDSKASGHRQAERSAASHDGTTLSDLVSSEWADPTSSSAATLASRSPRRGSEEARTIPATYGRNSPVSLASYDPRASCWRTFQATLLSEEPPSLATLPRWGMTRRGLLFELPTSELHTGGNAGSVSLPTPRGWDAEYRGKGSTPQEAAGLTGRPLSSAVLDMLPTPSASEAKGHSDGIERFLPTPVADHTRGNANPSSQYESLPNAVTDLLPTPRLGGMVHGYGEEEVQAGDPKHRLETRIEVQRRISSGEPTDPRSNDGSES